MDYEARYQEYQQAIEKYLDGLFTGDVAYGRLYEAMRYAILGGGKRIRPVLTLEFARLGGIDWHLALPSGCALELVHNYSLMICPAWTTTICAGASPPATKPTARRWPSWRATLCSRRRSG